MYSTHMYRNARLDESQARSKIAGRNINNFGYADDTTRNAEIEVELKSLLRRVKEESERESLRLNRKKQTNKQTRSWHLAPLLHGK